MNDYGLANLPWPLLLLGLEFPAAMALLDCWFRPADHFAEGAGDQRAWKGWLIVAVADRADPARLRDHHGLLLRRRTPELTFRARLSA